MRLDPLLDHYPVRIREVTLGVILGIAILFYIFPRFLSSIFKPVWNILVIGGLRSYTPIAM